MFKVLYTDGSEVHKGDRILIHGARKAVISAVLLPGTEGAENYALPEGGILVEFDDGELQAWPRVDEDMERVSVDPKS